MSCRATSRVHRRSVRTLLLFASAALMACEEQRPNPEPEASAKGTGSAMAAIGAAATRFQEDRRTRGDTVAMDQETLKAMLPAAPDGFVLEGRSEGTTSTIDGFSVTEVRQRYISAPRPEGGVRARIELSIVDFGGSDIGYQTLALPMLSTVSREDEQQRIRTRKLETANSWASEQYFKAEHSMKITAITRFRYVITLTSQGQGADPSAMLTDFTELIARQFETL